MNPVFIFNYLRSPIFMDKIVPLQKGASYPAVSDGIVYSQLIPVPPKGEQDRIVQKIETCFEKIDSTEQNLTKIETLLEKYRESLLAKAFRGELIPQDPNDEPARVLLEKIRAERAKNQKGKKKAQEFAPVSDDEKPFDIPESWEWVRLGEFTSGLVQKKPTESFSYIDIDAVDNKIFQVTNPKYLKPSDAPSRARKIVQCGDVIYSSVRPYLKNVAEVPEIENAVASTGFCVVKKQSFLHSKYLFYYLVSDVFLWLVEPLQKGASYPAINDTIFNSLILPLPPIAEQKKIALNLSNLIEKTNEENEAFKNVIFRCAIH